MYTLYDRPECPFCLKVRIVLAELNCAHETIEVTDKAQVAGLGPQGTTPVLVDGDLVVWESSVIAEYLNDRCAGRLMPEDPAEAAQVRLLHAYSDKVVGPAGLREVIFEKRGADKADWDEARIQEGETGWRACLDWLEGQIAGEGGLVGKADTLADCALFPRFALAEHYGVPVDDRHPKLKTWYGARKSRPLYSGTGPRAWSG